MAGSTDVTIRDYAWRTCRKCGTEWQASKERGRGHRWPKLCRGCAASVKVTAIEQAKERAANLGPYGRIANPDGTRCEAYQIREAAHEEVMRLRRDGHRARTTCRFVYYRLVARQVLPKDSQAGRGAKPSEKVASALTWLRQHGPTGDEDETDPFVDWSEIVDGGRTVDDYRGYEDPFDEFESVTEGLRLCPWGGYPPLLVVESRSLAAYFDEVAGTYRVPLVALGGQASGSYLYHQVAPLLGRATEVVYVGDYDKAGGDIEQSAIERLRAFAPRWNPTGWTRVAVTEEQFQEYGVNQGLAIRKQDGRDGQWYETLEAEALEQDEITTAVTDALDELGPDLAGTRAEEREQQEQWNWLLELVRDLSLEHAILTLDEATHS
jgi:hypothetical protein